MEFQETVKLYSCVGIFQEKEVDRRDRMLNFY